MASFHTTPVTIGGFFYPLGNTPAACLTQELAPEEPGRILLLGCGDPRHIFFTTYSDPGVDRHLDFTCCDNQPGILARNILLLTMFADGCAEDAERRTHVWDTCFSLRASDESLIFLHTKAEELSSLSASKSSWKDGKYGHLVRFCDDETRISIRRVWKEYALNSNRKSRRNRSSQLNKRLRLADNYKNLMSKGPVNILKAVTPVLWPAVRDSLIWDNQFWSEGSGSGTQKLVNPVLQPPSETTAVLHYGTSPLLGFHLATAFLPLTVASPMNPPSVTGVSQEQQLYNTAKDQLWTWAAAFKQRVDAGRIICRAFVGDAVHFLHALDFIVRTPGATHTRYYKDMYNMTPIVFDEDYRTSDDSPPVKFNVVDCSNLIDHIGPLNLLVAVSPLLLPSPSSSLYTDTMVRYGNNLTASFESFMAGSLRLVPGFLNLFPIAYVTNASAVGRDGDLLDILIQDFWQCTNPSLERKRQAHERLLWKVSPRLLNTKQPVKLHLESAKLTQLLYTLYLDLFQGENLSLQFARLRDSGPESIMSSMLCRYNRGSFALLCAFFKLHVAADWEVVCKDLLDQVENDTQLMIGHNYIQELHVQFHLLGLHTAPFIAEPLSFVPRSTSQPAFGSWENLPGVMRVTLVVPPDKLSIFTSELKTPWKVGCPNMLGVLQASSSFPGPRFQNFFAAINVAFGEVSTHGERGTSGFVVAVQNDPLGWTGSSPLIVSFWVPTSTLLWEPRTGEVALNLESTPQTNYMYIAKLGPEMQVYKTPLSDTTHVFITKDAPNIDQAIRHVGGLTVGEHGRREGSDVEPVIKMELDSRFEPRSLEARVDHLPDPLVTLLRSKAKVQTRREDLFTVQVCIGDDSAASNIQIRFPFPIKHDHARSKLRVARQSGYVEVSRMLLDPLSYPLCDAFLVPKSMRSKAIGIWNLPRLKLGCLPCLDFSRGDHALWLNSHVCTMWSAREREVMRTYSEAEHCPDPKLNFKKSLFNIIMIFTGAKGPRYRIFGLTNKARGGIDTLIVLLAIRLDVANHTIVLDVVVLPLTNHLVASVLPRFLSTLESCWGPGICALNVADEELTIWKHKIVSGQERIRSQPHKTTCEYLCSDSVPLSTKFGEIPICSCSMGQFEQSAVQQIPGFESISAHAVRAAISPHYGSPLVEKLPSLEEPRKLEERVRTQ